MTYVRTCALILVALMSVSACRSRGGGQQDDIRYDCSVPENMKLRECRR